MAAEEKWYFSKEQLANTPSKKHGYDGDKELSSRQQAANLIQDMGQRLQVTQLCINTAIVYMHRFYMFHSFNRFHRNPMAAAALFLAAKVEEQPRKLEHVIKVSQLCLHRGETSLDTKSESYLEQAQELVINENILLQTLGFDVAIDHPHTHVVRCCHLVKASKDLAQTSYFMASNSLHLTTMCLQYKPTVVACFCIHLASKWSNWEIPQSTEGKPWFWYVDKSVTHELLEQLTEEFLVMFEKCPSRLKKKIMSLSSSQNSSMLSAFNHDHQERKRNGEGSSTSGVSFSSSSSSSTNTDDIKKKQEYQRHHPDYKKLHMSHHLRPDSHGMQSSKSSCMFGPPRSTLPHSSSSSNQHGRTVPSKPNSGSSSSSSIQPEVSSNLGKPEYLHHRPRRPEEKVSRNHEPVHQLKKFETKVNSGVISDFNQAASSSGSNNSSSSRNFQLPTSHQQPPSSQPQEMVIKTEPMPLSNIKTEPMPLTNIRTQPTHPLLAPPVKPKTPPPVAKVSSIFSPEKSTPPADIKPQPQPPRLKVKEESLPIQIKLEEPIKPIPLVQPINIIEQKPLIIKEEKPPDLPIVIPDNQVPQESNPPQLTEETPVEQKKKKKKHKEHKEKHKDKQKDKHKHKHKNRDPEPIKITIPREKLSVQPQLPHQPKAEGIKIKITKDKKIYQVTPKVKIKIPPEKPKESKKRDRGDDGNHLPSKYHRPNGTSLQVGVEHTNRH